MLLILAALAHREQVAEATCTCMSPATGGRSPPCTGRSPSRPAPPVVEMNWAIAVAEIDGAEAGLAILDRLDLDHYRYFHSTRA